MLAGFVFKKDYFFLGKDNQLQLVEICKFLGTKKLFKYLNKYGIELNKHLYAMIGSHPAKRLRD